MDRRQRLVIALLLAMPVIASARYVSPSPPPGFTSLPGGGWGFKPPTPMDQLGSIMRGPGPSLAGAAETRAAYKLGAGAARALAKGLLGGGLLGAAVGGAAWLADHCFAQQNGQWVRTCGAGSQQPVKSDGRLYRLASDWTVGKYFQGPSASQVCQDWAAEFNQFGTSNGSLTYALEKADVTGCVLRRNDGPVFARSLTDLGAAPDCPAGWYITDTGCSFTFPSPVVTPAEVEDEMAGKPLPRTLPPGVTYPLDPQVPFIFNPDLANPPNAQPLRVPQGNPTPVPNTNPQQWVQPVTRYVPAPTPNDPTRLDAQPENVPTDQTGMTSPETVTSESPEGQPKEDERDLCEKNPDILACAKWKLGELDPTPVANENKTLAINKEDGFGPSNGTCPAPKVVSILGMQLSFSSQMLCDFATMIRPLLIGFAYLSAALTFMGIGRKD